MQSVWHTFCTAGHALTQNILNSCDKLVHIGPASAKSILSKKTELYCLPGQTKDNASQMY